MASPGRVPISLLTILLLVGPGLIGLDLFFRVTDKNRSLSRVQLIVYSATVSVASILLLYFFTPFYFTGLSAFSSNLATDVGTVTETELSELKIANIVSLYLIHFALAGILGAGLGYVANRRSEKERDRRDAWQYTFEDVPTDGEQIEVVLRDETTIQGQFNEKAWDEQQHELFLEDPAKVEYKEWSNKLEHSVDLGRSILLHEESISRVIFPKDDPQSEKDPADDDTKSGSPETAKAVGSAVDTLEAKAKLEETSPSPQDDMELRGEVKSEQEPESESDSDNEPAEKPAN